MTTEISAAAPPVRTGVQYTPWTHPFAEIAAVGAWFWTTANRFPNDTLVLYALTGYFMIGIYVHWRWVIPVIMRGWPIFILPAWALCSFIWSAVPSESFKIALQLTLTVLICCYIAARVSQRAFILAVFLALTWFELQSVRYLAGGPVDFQGVFQEKNFLALRMGILAFAALVVFFDDKYHRFARWVGAPVALLAMFMVYRSHSATSAITTLIGAATIIFCALVWRPAKGYRAMIVALGVAAVAGVGLIVVQDPGFNLETTVLSKFGKDSSLTGRQELWDYAGQLIEQKPFLGLGPGGFWLADRPDAQALLDTHYKPRGSQFYFHNSYIEITVYLGYIGLIAGLIGWVWSCAINFTRLFTHASAATAFFASLALVALARSYVESDLWQPFEFAGMIVWIGALSQVSATAPTKRVVPAAPKI